MIHYHGTPIGGSRQDTARFLLGRHALVPFTYADDLPVVAEACQSFILDNGAFTVWRKGGVLNYSAYVDFVEAWYRHPGFDFAIIPDAIEGGAHENNRLLKQWPKHLPGVPVYHLHEDLNRLQELAQQHVRVAIGGSPQWPQPGTTKWWQRMAEVMGAVTDSEGRPICKLHGLRMLDPEIFTRLPLSSADSTNVARNNNQLNRFGMYVPPTTAQRSVVIAERIEMQNAAACWTPTRQTALHFLPAIPNEKSYGEEITNNQKLFYAR